MYDPPSGWRYGFPREIPKNVKTDDDLKQWLLGCGYPEKDIEFALKWSRIFQE